MKLKSKKGLMVAYVEGIILLGIILLAGHLRGYSFLNLQSLILLLTLPLILIAIDTAFPAKRTFSVSGTVGTMGGVAIILLLEDSGFWLSTLWGMISLNLFWIIFSQINKGLFPQKKEEQG